MVLSNYSYLIIIIIIINDQSHDKRMQQISTDSKVIHWKMCKKFKFDHTNKWYMHKPAPVLENEMHKLLWDFNIQTDHLIPARRPDLIIITKKDHLQNCRLGCPGGQQNKSEGK